MNAWVEKVNHGGLYKVSDHDDDGDDELFLW